MIEIRLVELAKFLQAKLYGNEDIIITNIASIYTAKKGDVTFFTDVRLREHLISCQASAVILSEVYLRFCNIAALVVTDPYRAYVKTAKLMDTTPRPSKSIVSSAIIALSVILGKRVSIGANTVIESDVILGDDVVIGSGVFIGQNTKIGSGTRIWSNVSIHHAVEIGENCLIQSGVIIGSDGFGYINDRGVWIKIPQLGTVKIGNQVEIGSCTTIDRGSLDDTRIGSGVIIDNHCQVAHNVIIGEYTAIAGGVVMAGSLTIGRYCMIGGASVINGHINICDKVTVTGMSMVVKSITKPGIYSSGIPVQPNMEWKRTAVLVMRINSIYKSIKKIQNKLRQLLLLSP